MKTPRSQIKTGLLAASAFTLVLLSACNRQSTPSSQPPTASSQPKANVIRLFSWSDYFDPDVLQGFEDRTGIKVEYLTFSDHDELEAKLRSQPGFYDVIVIDDSSLQELWELRLIRNFNREKIPNLTNIDPQFLNLPFDSGNEYSAPYMWGTTLVAYRNDQIENPTQSWSLLWDENLKGKVMVLKDRLEALSISLIASGYPLNSEDPDQINHATDRLIEQLEKIDARRGDDADVRAALEEGSVAAAVCYSGDAAMVAAENEHVSFFIPAEGAPLWIDSFVIARDSSHPHEALQFINYMLEAENAAANSNYTYYASPNKAALPFIDAELLEDTTINPPAEVLARCAFMEKPSVQREELANRAWLKLQKTIQRLHAARQEKSDHQPTAKTKQ